MGWSRWLGKSQVTERVTGFGTLQACGTRTGPLPTRFYFEDAGSSVYRLRPKHAPDTCLDVPNSNFKPAVYLQTYTCNGTSAQTFKLFSHAGYTVIAADWNGSTPTICLDVHTNNQGERVWLGNCNSTGQQDWSLA